MVLLRFEWEESKMQLGGKLTRNNIGYESGATAPQKLWNLTKAKRPAGNTKSANPRMWRFTLS